MREFKYRAWLKNADKMVDVIAIDFEKEDICWIFDDYVNWEQERVWIGFDDIALMQYTGMEDKNGVEIYEGDIVGIDVYYVDDSGEPCKEIDYGEVLRDQSGLWDCDFKGYFGITPLIEYVMEEEGIYYPWNITVEGNIYENPELMT